MKNILKASANNELLFPCLENVNECMKQDKLGLFITQVLKEATNKHLSVNILRNIYTTEMYKETHSLAEREELVKMMGTSVKTQMLCYNKCCKDESKDDVESNNNSRLHILRRGRYQTYEKHTEDIDYTTTLLDTQSAATTQTTLSMARAEVTGYRLARLAMMTPSSNDNISEQNRVYMPEVLYFSHDDDKAPSILHLSM